MSEQIEVLENETADAPTGVAKPEPTEKQKQDMAFADAVKSAADTVRWGLRDGRYKKSEGGHDFRRDQVIESLIASEYNIHTDENFEKDELDPNLNERAKTTLDDFTSEANIEEVATAVADAIRKNLRAVRTLSTTRVTLPGGHPALDLAKAYVGFGASKKEIRAGMYTAATNFVKAK